MKSIAPLILVCMAKPYLHFQGFDGGLLVCSKCHGEVSISHLLFPRSQCTCPKPVPAFFDCNIAIALSSYSFQEGFFYPGIHYGVPKIFNGFSVAAGSLFEMVCAREKDPA
jgi:hypothetical protein